MKVPFIDLDKQYSNIKSEVLGSIKKVLESQKYIQGDFVRSFEDKFCTLSGYNYGIGCSNGTSALTVALRTLGVTSGDEVITVANTFFATIEAIKEVGAKPVLVDINPDDYLMNLNLVNDAITENTKCIIPVHLYGNPVDMTKLKEIAKKYSLYIIEDCAQAHLATHDGITVGNFGDLSTFSFYPGKNLGACGDAGFITTPREDLANLARMHINHGRTAKYNHEFYAGNFRMDGIQAAILEVKLRYLKDWTQNRIIAADYYSKSLEELGIKKINIRKNNFCVFHLYVIEVDNRDKVQKYLAECGVTTGIHYPIPIHMLKACEDLDYKEGDFPITESAAKRVISLPIFPEITTSQQDYVVEKLKEALQI